MKTEEINYFDNERNWIGYFLIESIGQKPEEVMMTPDYNPKSIEAQLIINGVSCDVTRTLEHMGNVFDEMVEKRARELIESKVEEKFFDQFNELESLTVALKEEVQDKIDNMLHDK
ncbi:hypothetical protein [Paenibacillus taichungensis]|uniref:hypothetical protein n=1 Tax=Paenibacillus taichungensis TaxID=484184 RepID=UPI0039A015DC